MDDHGPLGSGEARGWDTLRGGRRGQMGTVTRGRSARSFTSLSDARSEERPRRIFISYHHDHDKERYHDLIELFSNSYEFVDDNCIGRAVGNEDPEFATNRLAETCLAGTDVTIVLCSEDARRHKYVDWEIFASLDRGISLIGIGFSTSSWASIGAYLVPDRFYDNYDSGYALWKPWQEVVQRGSSFRECVENSIKRDSRLINNTRDKVGLDVPMDVEDFVTLRGYDLGKEPFSK